MAMTLYAHKLSSYCQKALIGLYELEMPFDLRALSPATPDNFAALLRLWPFGKFPVLDDDGLVVPEASLIIAHLDARAGGGRLLPTDPAARREVLLMDRVFDNYVSTPQQKIVSDHMRADARRDAQGVEEARALIGTSYAWLDARLAGRAWAAGDAFGLADCGAAPFLFYADWVQPIGDGFPTLAAYLKRLRKRPSVARAIDEARPYRHMVPGGIPDHVT
jgi:glutathione S-transferase